MEHSKYNFIFFGSDNFSVIILEELKKENLLPKTIVTVPDKPAGRKMQMKEPETKSWAKDHNIECLQPEKLDDDFAKKLAEEKWDFFVVASYGEIISKKIIEIPKHGTLNVHPSLLPLYRGASPIESAILGDQKETGVTIMLMDDKMDHGPILNQELVTFEKWLLKIEVEEKLAEIGGQLLAKTIEPWVNNEIEIQEQDHKLATFTKKIEKSDGEISLTDDPYKNFLKITALNPWPGTFFFINHQTKNGDKKIRVKITEANFDESKSDGEKLIIKKVIPEGKSEMTFESFKQGYKI